MVSPHPGSPWFRETQGLYGFAKPRVSPSAGSAWFHHAQGLHAFTKRRVSMVSPNSESHGFAKLPLCTHVAVNTPNRFARFAARRWLGRLCSTTWREYTYQFGTYWSLFE